MSIEINKFLEELKENCKLIGNNSLLRILEENDSFASMYKELRLYNSRLDLETIKEEFNEEDEEENQENKKDYSNYLIYIYGICINPKNIDRIELDQQYNQRYGKLTYFLNIYPKFSNGKENEDIYLEFKDKEERNFWFDVLRIKIKAINISII